MLEVSLPVILISCAVNKFEFHSLQGDVSCHLRCYFSDLATW